MLFIDKNRSLILHQSFSDRIYKDNRHRFIIITQCKLYFQQAKQNKWMNNLFKQYSQHIVERLSWAFEERIISWIGVCPPDRRWMSGEGAAVKGQPRRLAPFIWVEGGNALCPKPHSPRSFVSDWTRYRKWYELISVISYFGISFLPQMPFHFVVRSVRRWYSRLNIRIHVEYFFRVAVQMAAVLL